MKIERTEDIFQEKRVDIGLSSDQFAEKMDCRQQELEAGKKIPRKGEFYCPVRKGRREYYSQIKSNSASGHGGATKISDIICKRCFVKFLPEALRTASKR